jgi:hypothetical protein
MRACGSRLIPCPLGQWTAEKTSALTVAGQWRNFTAFPNILAIAVMRWAVLVENRNWHETIFQCYEHL